MLSNLLSLFKRHAIAVSLGTVAAVASLVLLASGFTGDSGVMIKLGCYTVGLSLASILWVRTGRYRPDNATQHILRIAAVVDGGLATQMILSYVFWALGLPEGSAEVYHSIVAEYFWVGPVMLVCAAFFYTAFKASFNDESYPM